MREINLNELLLLGENWLQSKIHRMRNLLKIAIPDEALYRELMLSLGYPKNKIHFLELALILPYREIKELNDREKIETALLYRGGFSTNSGGLPQTFDTSLKMDKSIWSYYKIRPANFPEKRIRGISLLLYQSINPGLVNYFLDRISREARMVLTPDDARKLVQNIMKFSGIGKQRKTELFFNIILPFFITHLNEVQPSIVRFLTDIFKLHPPLAENYITRSFRKSLPDPAIYPQLNQSTKTYFGIHFWYQHHQS